jgi:hypothetical protein
MLSWTPLFMAVASLNDFTQAFPWSTPYVVMGCKVMAILYSTSWFFVKVDFDELVSICRIVAFVDVHDHISALRSDNLIKIIRLCQHWRPENPNLGRVGLDGNGIYQWYLGHKMLPPTSALTLNPDKSSYISTPSLEKALSDINECVRKNSLSGEMRR